MFKNFIDGVIKKVLEIIDLNQAFVTLAILPF